MKANISIGLGDGISLGFHTGNTSEVGRDGGSLGFATLPNSFGWKADTYPNTNGADSPQDHDSAGHQYFGADPSNMNKFGAFVETDPNNGVTINTINTRKLQEQVSHLDRAGSRWPVIL